jgi:hypothetical protein
MKPCKGDGEEEEEEEEEEVQAQPNDETVADYKPLILSSVKTLPVTPQNILSVAFAAKAGAATLEVKEDMRNPPPNNTASQSGLHNHHRSSPKGAADDRELIQGVMLSRSIAVGNKSPLYAAGSLETQIEYPMEEAPTLSDGALKELGYGIEWVTAEEANRLQEHRAMSIIDAEALQGETSYEVDDQNCLFIVARGALIKILLQPRPTRLHD